MDFLRRPLPYRAEYAPSPKSKCDTCFQLIDSYIFIERKCLRMTAMEKGKFDGRQNTGWHHIHCFFDTYKAEDITIEKIENFARLRYKDQNDIRERINKMAESPIKMDIDDELGIQDQRSDEDLLLEKQSKLLYSYFDKLDEQLSNKELTSLFEENGIQQKISLVSGRKPENRLFQIYNLADAMTFGVPEICPNFKDKRGQLRGQLIFRICGYICAMGKKTTIIDCDYYTTLQPNRSEFKVPEILKTKYEFLNKYKYEERKRQYISDLKNVMDYSIENDQPSLNVLTDFSAEAQRGTYRIDDVFNGSETIENLVEKFEKLKIFQISDFVNRMKLLLKEGYAVDSDTGLCDSTHIYSGYDCVLTYVTFNGDRNSFYRLQLLEEDEENKDRKYYIFRKWGRIGQQNNFKTSCPYSFEEALKEFNKIFEDKTDNIWKERFRQKPFKYYRLNIENFKEHLVLDSIKSKAKHSIHPEPVQQVMLDMFDIEKLKKQWFELKIDTNLMPLGMLSYKHISKVERDLQELYRLIENNSKNETKILHLSTKFYQNIPHISPETHPKLTTIELVEEKMEMCVWMKNIQITYDMLCPEDIRKPIVDITDHLLAKLNINLKVLEKESPEFKIIEKYMKRDPIRDFSLRLENVFEIEGKNSTNERMKMCRKLLLWHGSLTTNFAGILSKGFEINPKPTNGRFFGDGIYFADSVYKSGQYCSVSGDKGLLLLCVVNREKMEKINSTEKLAEIDYKSVDCIKLIGEKGHDPKGKCYLPNNRDISVPLGKMVDQDTQIMIGRNKLRFNEYLVPNIENIGFKYLVECVFQKNC